MATRSSKTTFAAYLKEVYSPHRVELLAANDHKVMKMLRKVPRGGEAFNVDVLYGSPAGRSRTYANAWTNANTTKSTKFVISDLKDDFNVVQIESKVMALTERGDWSKAKTKMLEVKCMLEELGKSFSLSMFRDTTGIIGTISAIGNGSGTNDLLTLSNKSDAHNFSIGQVLNFRDVTNSNTLIDSDGSTTAAPVVEAIDHSAGTIEVNANTAYSGSSGTNVAVGDTIVADGDNGSSLAGFASWLPLTAPSSGDSFFSVDRSTNVAALAGHRVDNTGRSILENGEELKLLVEEFGGKPDVWVMNPRAGRQLSAQLGTKVERSDGGMGRYGFSDFELVGWMGRPIKVVFDYTCPVNRAYMLQLDTWAINHVKGVPHLADEDGLTARHANSSFDGINVLARYWAEISCHAPGYNGVMSVATS